MILGEDKQSYDFWASVLGQLAMSKTAGNTSSNDNSTTKTSISS